MFKWLGKLKWWNSAGGSLAVHEYGRYVYKPVVARALSVVMNISQHELVEWIQNPDIDIYLNKDLIQGTRWARQRLESGGYEIKIPQMNKIWRFFIA